MSGGKKAPQECPCGFFNDGRRECICAVGQIGRYLGKISGPLLDRIDLQVEVPALTPEEIASTTAGEASALIRDRVEAARGLQRERFRRSRAECNAEMSTRQMRRFCELGPSSRRLLEHAVARLALSARGYDRVLKVSRTISDLAHRQQPCRRGRAVPRVGPGVLSEGVREAANDIARARSGP